jgi:hypothetical protein
VEHGVNPGDDFVDQFGVQDRAEYEFGIGTVVQVLDIGQSTRGEVIEQDYLVATIQQVVGKV